MGALSLCVEEKTTPSLSATWYFSRWVRVSVVYSPRPFGPCVGEVPCHIDAGSTMYTKFAPSNGVFTRPELALGTRISSNSDTSLMQVISRGCFTFADLTQNQ